MPLIHISLRAGKPDWPELIRHWPDGRLKLAWTAELLKLRREYPDLFAKGDYIPMEVHGRDREHVIAFARRNGRNTAVIAAGRWFGRCTDGGRSWPQTTDMQAEIDVAGVNPDLRPDRIQVSECFEELPVAVMIV